MKDAGLVVGVFSGKANKHDIAKRLSTTEIDLIFTQCASRQ